MSQENNPANPRIVRDEMLVHQNEQVYEFQPPKPYHPQSKFGSGVEAAAQVYPNLAAYYGREFMAHFTTWDVCDSLAARIKELEDQGALGMEIAKRYDAQFQRMVTDIFAEPAKPVWWKRVLVRVKPGLLGAWYERYRKLQREASEEASE